MCWKQGNTPIPEHVKKRRAAAELKRKEETNKKPKTDQVTANYTNNNTEIVYAYPAIIQPNPNYSEQLVEAIDAFILPQNIPRSKGYHHYIDSGAGRYLSGHKSSFTSFINLDHLITISGFARKRIITQKGTMKINISVANKPQVLIIHNVLFAPSLPFSLLSVKAFSRKGLRTTFDKENYEIVRKDTNQVIAVGESLTNTNLYRLILGNETPSGTHFDAYHIGIKDSTPNPTSDNKESLV